MRRFGRKVASLIKEAAPITKLISEFPALRAGQWKIIEEVLRRTSLAPLASPYPMLSLTILSVEAEGLVDFRGGRGSPPSGRTFARSMMRSLDLFCQFCRFVP